MKVLLFTGYGTNFVTPEMEKIMKKNTYPKNRIGEIIDYIEKNAITAKLEDYDKLVEILKKNKNQIYKIVGKTTKYIIWNDDIQWTCSFQIVEVDISKRWRIRDYDGAEHIEYLDYKLIDKEMNYYDYS